MRSDWLKERALSECRGRSVEKWRTNFCFCFGILTKLTQNLNVLIGLAKRKEDELFVCNKHGLREGHC